MNDTQDEESTFVMVNPAADTSEPVYFDMPQADEWDTDMFSALGWKPADMDSSEETAPLGRLEDMEFNPLAGYLMLGRQLCLKYC